jgi:2-methylcitrate dehydratase
MVTTLEFAAFVQETEYGDLSADVRAALRGRLLDSIGAAVAAEGASSAAVVDRTIEALETRGACTRWGREQGASPVQTAMYNTALIRDLDAADSFLAPGETSHPSDTVAAVIAAGEYAGATGKELLTGLAIAYEIAGELAWNAPVRDRGFDHVSHTVVSVAAGASKLLGLDREQTRDAIAIAATGHNALRVTRTGSATAWEWLASANAARNGVYAALLAAHGMAGPRNAFDGQKGWQTVVATPFEVELTPGERVHDATTNRYVAASAAQSAIEGILGLAEKQGLDPAGVAGIKLETFASAKRALGGGEGNPYEVDTREQAGRSLPYLLAAALLDRELSRAQYDPERIRRNDVQELLRIVGVTEDPALTARFEEGALPAVLDVTMADGTTYRVEKDAARGHPTRPLDRNGLEAKFEAVTANRLGDDRRSDLLETIRTIEEHQVSELTSLLGG